MTIGDIIGIIAAIAAICAGAWGLTVTCGLLFTARAETARQVIVKSAKSSIGIGAAVTLVPGFVGLVLLGVANPGAKLAGMLVILAILACGAVGGAGLAFVAGERIREMDESLSDYAVFSRGAAFLVAASIFPVLGWFGFAPLAFFAAVGSGARALNYSRTVDRSQAGQIG
jgi:hypothetical protein